MLKEKNSIAEINQKKKKKKKKEYFSPQVCNVIRNHHFGNSSKKTILKVLLELRAWLTVLSCYCYCLFVVSIIYQLTSIFSINLLLSFNYSSRTWQFHLLQSLMLWL